MNKNFRDTMITIMALGTAYGLGVISCLYAEAKLFIEACEATKKEE